MIRLALLFVLRFDQAEEVVGQVFLKLLRKKESLMAIQNLEGYLLKMVKHECLIYLKTNKKRDSGKVLVDDLQDYLLMDQNDPEKWIFYIFYHCKNSIFYLGQLAAIHCLLGNYIQFHYISIMKQKKAGNKVNEPFTEYGRYSYSDYLEWQMDEMVELIKGKVFRQAAAAPRRIHQKISGKVFAKIFNFLEERHCEVYEAPFDVRLPVKSKRNEDIDTVVQPDICVICDKSKLDQLGCIGAPDLIIEILSPGSNKKELKNKYEVYEESGVGEYWIIHPDEQTVMTYTLVEGKYVPSRLFTSGDVIASKSISGFQLDLEYVFKDLD